MLFTFSKYQERKDALGHSFLDVDCLLFTSEPKVTRVRISIPSSADFDTTNPYQAHQLPVISFFDQPL